MERERRKTPFLIFFNGDYRPTPPPALPVYPAGGDPSPPAHPDRLHITGSSTGRASTRAGQVPGQTMTRTGTHAQTLNTLHRSALDTRQDAPGRSYRRRRWRAWSVSDRARPNGQTKCKQKYLFFMCKPLDKRNKIVYNIDSKQTYLHHHKTGGQKP